MADFWSVLREVDPQNVIREAEQPLRLVVCGSPGVGKRTLAAALTGGEYIGPNASGVTIDVCDMPDDVPVAMPSADLYIYVASAEEQIGALHRAHLAQLGHRSGRVVCALNRRGDADTSLKSQVQHAASDALGIATERILCTTATDRQAVQRELVPGLLREVTHLALPLGRHLAAVRDPAADFLIADTARINAEFSVVSSLPMIVPVVGMLTSMGTDMIVLTKNQVMLLLKLALLHQRPIDNRLQVLAEVAPVIGAAFFWRTAARSLVTMLPGPLAVAPRGAVAYVGTYVVGKAGQYYYRSGRRPSPDILDTFRDDALRQLTGFTPLLSQVGRHFRFL